MGGKTLGFCLALVLPTLIQVTSQSGTYRGAVVEYHPVIEGPNKLDTAKNVQNYIRFIEEAAKKGAQIIVFPEGGISNFELSPIPDPADRIAPCDSSTFNTTETVRKLSLASKMNHIYSVVNLREKRNCTEDDENCPTRKYYIFNTNVVFDIEGTVIARYAKYNLFDEPLTDRTKDPELVFFDTYFNVRFGTFTCFDILFSTPSQRMVQQYQITNFVFTTFWFSELPFLTALQAQKGWAETNNVNLLASGVNYVSKGSTGSGIYNGKYGELVQVLEEKTVSKLLIADIPIIKNSNSVVAKRDSSNFYEVINLSNTSHFPSALSEAGEGLFLLKDQITLYSSGVIQSGKIFEQTVCSHSNFCCDFYVDMDSLMPESKNYTYRAMAFNGVRKFGLNFRGGIQTCAVVVCDGPNIENCTSRVKKIPGLFKFKEIRIKGNFKLRNSMQMPSTLTDGELLKPLPSNKYEFKKTEKDNKMEVSLKLLWPVFDLHAFAIFGRDFTRDNEPTSPSPNSSAVISAPVVLGALVIFILRVQQM